MVLNLEPPTVVALKNTPSLVHYLTVIEEVMKNFVALVTGVREGFGRSDAIRLPAISLRSC